MSNKWLDHLEECLLLVGAGFVAVIILVPIILGIIIGIVF